MAEVRIHNRTQRRVYVPEPIGTTLKPLDEVKLTGVNDSDLAASTKISQLINAGIITVTIEGRDSTINDTLETRYIFSDAITPHAGQHAAAGIDPVEVDTLAATGQPAGRRVVADGADGLVFAPHGTPEPHDTTHQHGGADEVATATPGANQIPKADGTGRLDGGWTTYGTGTDTACEGDDARLSDARTPVAHNTTHQHGGSDEVGTATPGANAVPKADGAGKLDGGWTTYGTGAATATEGNDTRVPSQGENDALQGTSGVPSNTNRYVTNGDSRNTDARAPTGHNTTHQHGGGDEIATTTPGANQVPKADGTGKIAGGWTTYGTGAGTACEGNDSRLSDSRAPTSHAASHAKAGGDPIECEDLAATGETLGHVLAADGSGGAQFQAPGTPGAHAASHQNGGADEVATATPGANAIPKAQAGGTLAGGWVTYGTGAATATEGNDTRVPSQDENDALQGTSGTPSNANRYVTNGDARNTNARTPTSHASSHENGGGDEMSVAGLSGTLADAQTPTSHASSHENGGGDEMSVAGLSGTLADAQTPTSHSASHKHAGADEVGTATPGANAIPKAQAGGTLAGGWITYGVSVSTACEGNDSRLSDSRAPTSHASSHQNGGADEIATATPAANAIPKAGAGSKLAGGWVTYGSIASTAVQGNDTRVPSQDENDALVGTNGTPSTSNKYVTNSDPRNTDSRTPTSHASSHITGGGDAVDGDQLDITWSPTNYTRSTAPTEVTVVQHLTAHLSGIDTALGVATQVFGTDYQRVTSVGRSTTTALTMQPKLQLVTGALTGTYRVQWGAVVDTNNSSVESQLYNVTDVGVIGTVRIVSAPPADRLDVCGNETLVLTGSSKTIEIQYRAISAAKAAGIQTAYIEFWRVS